MTRRNLTSLVRPSRPWRPREWRGLCDMVATHWIPRTLFADPADSTGPVPRG
ncbi:hypothetical protein X961_5740 [Burkholderia pseudomallei MSHR5613]|nr:hypothetical protein X961_5740 [Burkholderia pseudomallei MSHR5613]